MANKKAGSFIKISRNILSWQWLTKPNHLLVWMYILLNASYHDTYYQGVEIKRGDMVTSYRELAQHTNLSLQNVRTVINHLISTGEITRHGYRDFTVLTVVNYDKYQTKQHTK